jgi:DNA-binding transcriptional regulator YdaS (Cro superfamily)
MDLVDKLQNYFRENGIQRKWFANKIGLSPHFFYQILHGTYKLPPSTWYDVIAVTKGAITLADLLEEEFKHADCLSFAVSVNYHICEAYIKNNLEKK